MVTAKQWYELGQQWREVFDEDMPQGFALHEGDYDTLRECVEKKSQEPLDALVEQRLQDGRVY